MTISLRSIYGMSDDEARAFLTAIRWGDDIKCPECGDDHITRLPTRGLYRCKGCRKQFSETSQSALASRKAKLQDIIAAAYLFCASAKGVASLQAARMTDNDQKIIWVLFQKFREAIYAEVSSLKLTGIVEIDGATFGGHRRHANMAQDFSGSFKRFQVKNKAHQRVIVVAKQRGGRTVPFIVGKESEACPQIAETVDVNAIIQADGARAWDGLHRLFDMMRIEHKYAFSANMACTNNAESFFARMRKTHSGTHHRINAENLHLYAAETAWKSDFNKLSTAERTIALLKLALTSPPSARFAGYWQRTEKLAA